jgi:DNA-binding SARP family transcriptional activator
VLDYRILGSFDVRQDSRLLGLGGEKPRALLAILLLHRNEVVSVDRLIDGLWGEAPPASALPTLRAYVSRLRKALNGSGESVCGERDSAAGSPDGVLLTRGRGYLLRVAPGELDLERFLDVAERGHHALAAGDADGAARALREALGLWRGPPLADFAYEPFARGAIAL